MKSLFSTLSLVLSIICFFFYTMMDSMMLFAVGTLCALPGLIGLFSSKRFELKVFTIVAFIGSILNILWTSYGIGGSIVFLVCCGITFSCLKHIKVFFSTTLFICLGLIAFLFYQIFIFGIENVDDIFKQYDLSKNYPGSLLVMFNCLWAEWKYMYYRKMPLVLPILSTIIAFFLDGRSSLICMILITVICFVFRGKKLTVIMTSLFIVLISYYWNTIIDFYELTSLASKGVETSRVDLWNSYFNHLDFPSLLFGLDTQNLPVLKDYGGNPHNSFLSFHRRMGFLGFSVLMTYIYNSLRMLIKRKCFVLVYFNVVLLIRMFFDGMLVTGEDFFILTAIFIPFCINNKSFSFEKQLEVDRKNLLDKLLYKLVYLI